MILYIKYSIGISCHQPPLNLKRIVLKSYKIIVRCTYSIFTIKMEGNRNILNKHLDVAKSAGVSLNVYLAVPPSTTAAQDGSHTPNTGEILDSLVDVPVATEAMNAQVGPFSFPKQCAIESYPAPDVSIPSIVHPVVDTPTTLSSFVSGNVYLEPPTNYIAPPINSPGASSVTSGSTLESPMSNYPSSPATTPNTGPGTIQHLTSQFIKEGLKDKVKRNMGGVGGHGNKGRRASSTKTSLTEGDSIPGNKPTLFPPLGNASGIADTTRTSSIPLESLTEPEQKFPINVEAIKKEQLTPDDTTRRSRRRERNKVAATKCRNKKKARTQILIRESETLSVQNQSLKSEIQKLEKEKVRLMQVLSGHENACLQRIHDAVEIKSEELASPMDEDEFRVPYTVPPPPMITSSQASLHSTPTFSQSALPYTDSKSYIAPPNFSNTVPMASTSSSTAFASTIISTHPDMQPPSSFIGTSHELEGTFSNSVCQPPSFDDAIRMASQIKIEDAPREPIAQSPDQQELQIQQPVFQGGAQQLNENQNDYFRAATFGYSSISEASSHFLVKRPLGHTYLDLDNRCIAL